MPTVHVFDAPQRFCAGRLGDGDDRRLCLQAREGSTLVTVEISEVNLEALRETLLGLLADRGSAVFAVAREPEHPGPLDAPVEPAFDAVALAVFDDVAAGALVVLASSVDVFGEPHSEATSFGSLVGDALTDPSVDAYVVTIRLTIAQVVDFVVSTQTVLADGRPSCPLCAQPVDPRGHVCPRRNGYRGPDAWPTKLTRLP